MPRYGFVGPPRAPFVPNMESQQATGLVGWWPILASYGATRIQNPIGKRQSGILNGGITWSTNNTLGAYATFNGTTGYIAADGAGVYSPTQPYSFAAWLRCTADATERRVISEGSSVSNEPIFSLGTRSGDAKLDMYLRANNGVVQIDHVKSNTSIWDGVWHHVIWADHTGAAQVYIDGKSDSTNFAYTPTTYTFNKLTFGALGRASYGNFFNGNVAEVRTYNRKLTAADAAAMYDSRSRWELYYYVRRRWICDYAAPTFQAAWAAHSSAQIGTGVN